MRMRFKPYARPELAAWEYFIDHPAVLSGRWANVFDDPALPLRVEFGCGKGGFLARQSLAEPGYNYLGVDIKSEMLVVAKRTIEKSRSEADRPTDNIRLAAYDIERIGSVLLHEDAVDRIYVNFCNPWYKSGHAKHRLTHPRQLIQYRDFLRTDGEIHFKTDDLLLYYDSLRYFEMTGFEIKFSTEDLHAQTDIMPVMTEHETMFSAKGVPIKACIAQKRPATLDKAFFSQLRNI